ncbi:hypothetical protein Tco_1210474 [Tanacetum coccineum]
METFLQTLNEFTNLDDDFYDTEGYILYLKQLLNEDPSPTLPPKKNEDLKEVTKAKPSIEEPPELELKDLPSHLKYAYLEENDKLLVIIAKDLKDVEKEALLKVLKSHKRAIAWKITDIKGIDPRFCTHKILMEDDYKLTVQSQRRVNPKIHEVIKKEVLKLLDARMIYPIFDSPWVSPVHCVLKKRGITVVANEENELIPTRLVTGWRVCIDYRKLNEATRKDHFPLLFMDQMLERLAGNEFYCFLDGFLGYFQIPIDPQDQEKTTFTCPYGTFARAFNQKSATKTNNLNEKVKTAKVNNVTTAGPKAVVSAAKANRENAVKSLACWIYILTGNVIYRTSKDSGSYMLKRFDYVDLQGRLNKRLMVDLLHLEEVLKEVKLLEKGKIRTGKLDFEDVYFIKELKFNLFSVSQMCDKKSNVLFTKTECFVLSPDFKLLDESQVLLKVPR